MAATIGTRRPKGRSSGGVAAPAVTTTASASTTPVFVSIFPAGTVAAQVADPRPFAQLDALAPQLRGQPGHERLGPDVAINARAHDEARVVAERGLDCARGLQCQGLDRALEAERLQILEDRREPGDAVLAACEAEDAAAVHLELDAGLCVAVELAEGARVEVVGRAFTPRR